MRELILVSVGTHEQQFNRLLKAVDKLVEKGIITDRVVAQTGFSDYEPKEFEWKQFYKYQEMQELAKEADILITHGGPSSFIMALKNGKIPIVVPRRAELGEHVNDHQVKFCHSVAERYGNIIVIDDIDQLGDAIERYDEIVAAMPAKMKSNNKNFCDGVEKIALKLAGGKHA